MYDLSEIKKIRKKNNLTQGTLAKISGVSQSLIAKIESGRIDPTFSKTMKIFQVLEAKALKNEKKVDDIMQKNVICVDPSTSVIECVKKMKRFAISQMPVMEAGLCVGSISETTLLETMVENKYDTVNQVMEDIPPIVSKNTTLKAISSLLKHFQMIIVSDKGKIKGIVTRTDILNNI